MVDQFAKAGALQFNTHKEIERNKETAVASGFFMSAAAISATVQRFVVRQP